MFEHFTEHAHDVMDLANQEAQRFGQEYVGTEHLLWGLAKEVQGVAAAVLDAFQISLKPLRREVEALLRDRPHAASVQRLPQSPHAKQVIQYAIEEARLLHHDHVGTEHLLLGMMRDGKTTAAQVLANLGLRLETVRDKVRELSPAD